MASEKIGAKKCILIFAPSDNLMALGVLKVTF